MHCAFLFALAAILSTATSVLSAPMPSSRGCADVIKLERRGVGSSDLAKQVKVSKGMQEAVDRIASLDSDLVYQEKDLRRVIKGAAKSVPGAHEALLHFDDIDKTVKAINAVAEGPGKHTAEDFNRVKATSIPDEGTDPALTTKAKAALDKHTGMVVDHIRAHAEDPKIVLENLDFLEKTASASGAHAAEAHGVIELAMNHVVTHVKKARPTSPQHLDLLEKMSINYPAARSPLAVARVRGGPKTASPKDLMIVDKSVGDYRQGKDDGNFVESSFARSQYNKAADKLTYDKLAGIPPDAIVAHNRPPGIPTDAEVEGAISSVENLPLHEILRSRDDIGVLEVASKKNPKAAELYDLVRQREEVLQVLRKSQPGQKVALPIDIQHSDLLADEDLKRMVSAHARVEPK
ncbi:hypothetical protein FRB96_007701 [Tulasnella sp. 330]|nr:hypothetical protein FRB96_007701 [Tulasnella sp. 330]KAG8881764.1 hypothetical protein FRB97_009173 [Tulasnella sp. 331]